MFFVHISKYNYATNESLISYIHFYRLLIGAPRAKALANQGANITGGLYSCDITTHTDDCNRIEFDNDGQLCKIKIFD